jgi:hypothetical protein
MTRLSATPGLDAAVRLENAPPGVRRSDREDDDDDENVERESHYGSADRASRLGDTCPVIEQVLLAFSGMLVGAGRGAAKRTAPRALTRLFYGFAAVFFVLAAVTFKGGP